MTVCGIKQADGVCVMGKCSYFKKCCPAVWDKSCEPLTNEEWFCSLPTEEKAKFLRQIYRDGRDDYVGEWYEQTEADFVQWLKEIHE